MTSARPAKAPGVRNCRKDPVFRVTGAHVTRPGIWHTTADPGETCAVVTRGTSEGPHRQTGVDPLSVPYTPAHAVSALQPINGLTNARLPEQRFGERARPALQESEDRPYAPCKAGLRTDVRGEQRFGGGAAALLELGPLASHARGARTCA